MSNWKSAKTSAASGYQPQAEKQKLLVSDAARAEEYIRPHLSGRVRLENISFLCGQGIFAAHAHDIAEDVCTNGTSKRRCNHVKLVEVPEDKVEKWLAANKKKAERIPRLADFAAMSHTGPYYAAVGGRHFVEAHKLIMEGTRRFRDEPEGLRFILKDDDDEGRLIQERGVLAVVYSAELNYDIPALFALMREDNKEYGV